MSIRYDIQRDEIVLHVKSDSDEISAYTIIGGYNTSKDYKVSRSILPEDFFNNFAPGKFVYNKGDNKVEKNYSYVPIEDNNNRIDSDVVIPEKQDTVPKSEYDDLKRQFEEQQKQIEQIMKFLKLQGGN